ncbi:hypothetical protein NIES4071_54650 [Calothrix sp. NIES-4071]|nr:hypothetical protein NIES4071_54650 [Calothrix sp. NIES-4071]BAZ59773.1 hypothetical protein NIES4105_54600 [Calothrix sp. NIES-4105]
MQHDLKGLEISQKELQQLTNLPVNEELVLVVNKFKQVVNKFFERARGPEAATAYFLGISSVVFSYLILGALGSLLMPWLPVPSGILAILLLGISGASAQYILYFIWKQRNKIVQANITPSLKILLSDVERYNNVIKAIHINDEIEAAGNVNVGIKERNKVLDALSLTRADLIRAVKTERILRENKNFIIGNSELFANNLPTLSALQVSEQATEHGRLLNEALQIALDVQLEMKRLQSQS